MVQPQGIVNGGTSFNFRKKKKIDDGVILFLVGFRNWYGRKKKKIK